jgi:DNA repair protein RecN (Recombination protein N)
MLSELSIKNFVLIDSAQIEFKKGLNVLTGETGAGKSVIMNALSMVLGERASSDLIRRGAEQATVEAVYDLDRGQAGYARLQSVFEESGLDLDDTLILKRTLNTSGKNRCYVNNSPTTLKALNEIGKYLVDLHGQHDHQTLLNPKNYLGILDSFGELELDADDLRISYEEWRKIKLQYQDLLDRERERTRLLDQLRFQTNEIERAELREGEEDDLNSEKRKLKNFETLSGNGASILAALDGSDGNASGVVSQLGQVLGWIEAMAEKDSELSDVRNVAENANYAVEDLAQSIRSYCEKLESQPGRLDEIEARLELIKNLKKKYGNSIGEVNAFLATSKDELAKLENFEEERGRLETQLKELTQTLGKKATALSKKRRKAAKQLSGEVSVEMRQLSMETARFEVEVSLIDPGKHAQGDRIAFPQDDESPITKTGWDEVDFKISTNPGEPLKTLRQVASGGEISRIMLAIKAVLARVDPVDMMVFDEIDAGIGGKTAHVVGGKIKSLSQDRQIVCITHLAPIASKADHHLLIEKATDGTCVSVLVEYLDEEKRAHELTRMIGAESTEDGLKVAEEMLQAY